MQTKLTLRMDENIIAAAKRYSKKRSKSLSHLVSDYLYLITQEPITSSKTHKTTPPITQSLKGILRSKKVSEMDYRKYLAKKYQ